MKVLVDFLLEELILLRQLLKDGWEGRLLCSLKDRARVLTFTVAASFTCLLPLLSSSFFSLHHLGLLLVVILAFPEGKETVDLVSFTFPVLRFHQGALQHTITIFSTITNLLHTT